MITVLRPTRGWVGIDLRSLIDFRYLLAAFAIRDIKLRYKQTLLGVGWVLIQPLAAAGIFGFVFGVVAGFQAPSGGSYFVYSFAGLLVWNVFSSTFLKSATCMVGNVQLVTKVYFPRLILPLSTVASTLIDFMIPAAALALFLLVTGQLGWSVALLPVWVALALLMGLGLGLVAAALTVEYRDVQYILPLVTPFLLYASPVAYDTSHVPAEYRELYYLVNPLASIIEGFRWSVMGAQAPPWRFVAYAFLVSVVLFALGALVFRSRERRLADVI